MTFEEREAARANLTAGNVELESASKSWIRLAGESGHQYMFDWLGLPIIQIPQDMVAVQEVIWNVRPDLIIETGIARGGSLALSASLLCLLDIVDGIDPRISPRRVLGVDIDIRAGTREALDKHPLRFKMELIEGSSVDSTVVQRVSDFSQGFERVLVALDSDHTHSHVLAELEAYSGMVSVGSYCIVFDTVIENLPLGYFSSRHWDVGNNPMTAVRRWIVSHPEFVVDGSIDDKLLVSVAPGGYLKRIA